MSLLDELWSSEGDRGPGRPSEMQMRACETLGGQSMETPPLSVLEGCPGEVAMRLKLLGWRNQGASRLCGVREVRSKVFAS